MKTDLKHSHQVRAQGRQHSGFAPSGVAPLAGGSYYSWSMHPGIVRDAPGRCPERGMALTPIFEAIARAAMALRLLSAATNALRLDRAKL